MNKQQLYAFKFYYFFSVIQLADNHHGSEQRLPRVGPRLDFFSYPTLAASIKT